MDTKAILKHGHGRWRHHAALAAAAIAQAGGCTPSLYQGHPSGGAQVPVPASPGVVRPPLGIDPGIHVWPLPPSRGTMRVIPPPGSPGGDPRIQPR